MRKLFLILVMSFCVGANCLRAQTDPHFTQYYANPLWLNPALTGLIDGNYRVGANFRQQLPGLYSPMVTKGVTADFALPKSFGLGVTAFNQSSADAGYSYTNAYLSLSYQVHLSQYKILSSGFQLGVLNRKVDPYKMRFGTQYNPLIGYDPSMPSNEVFAYQSATSADGSIGLFYFDGDPAKSWNPFFGASLYHPTQPTNQFLSSTEDHKIAMRYALHGGIRFQAGKRTELIPHALLLMQGGTKEIVGGLACNFTVQPGTEFIVGATYRVNDAVAPNLGFHFGGLTIGLSYDINISELKTVSSSNGGYELSISFTSQKKIPDTKFICPRL